MASFPSSVIDVFILGKAQCINFCFAVIKYKLAESNAFLSFFTSHDLHQFLCKCWQTGAVCYNPTLSNCSSHEHTHMFMRLTYLLTMVKILLLNRVLLLLVYDPAVQFFGGVGLESFKHVVDQTCTNKFAKSRLRFTICFNSTSMQLSRRWK